MAPFRLEADAAIGLRLQKPELVVHLPKGIAHGGRFAERRGNLRDSGGKGLPAAEIARGVIGAVNLLEILALENQLRLLPYGQITGVLVRHRRGEIQETEIADEGEGSPRLHIRALLTIQHQHFPVDRGDDLLARFLHAKLGRLRLGHAETGLR